MIALFVEAIERNSIPPLQSRAINSALAAKMNAQAVSAFVVSEQFSR
jgi:hypothetical protein